MQTHKKCKKFAQLLMQGNLIRFNLYKDYKLIVIDIFYNMKNLLTKLDSNSTKP